MDKDQIIILLVDDSDIFLKILLKTIHQLGFKNVEVLMSGHEALSWLEGYKAHLVLMDTHMPDMMGYKVCSEIKSRKEYENMIVVGMSDFDYSAAWYESGADYFIEKNHIFNKKELFTEMIDNLIKKIPE